MSLFDAWELTPREVFAREGADTSEAREVLIRDAITGETLAPALCSAGCEVEPDGTCEHGFPSILTALGFM